MLIALLIIGLLLWLVLALVGFIVKGLLWLGFVALGLFAATAVWGMIKAVR